jgi:sensor histidine kinase regulating citrate/malate metabolism
MKSETLSDPDMQKATAALNRAAKRARQIAEQTGTAVVVIRDGKLIREMPKSEQKVQKSMEISE